MHQYPFKAFALLVMIPIMWSCGPSTVAKEKSTFIGDIDHLLIPAPEHGYVTHLPATKWEEAMLTGNGTIGALVMGHSDKEVLILSHEQLFMPEFPPTKAPDLGPNMESIRKLVMEGKGEEASLLAMEIGEEAGIDGMIWTDPLIPACRLEIEHLDPEALTNYSRSVNYETGEATTAWTTSQGRFQRTVFASRADGLVVTRIEAPEGQEADFRIRLSQLPLDEEGHDLQPDLESNALIDHIDIQISEEGKLSYNTKFKKKWEGSLKGFTVESMLTDFDGKMRTDGEWLYLEDCSYAMILSGIRLSHSLPIDSNTGIAPYSEDDYDALLHRHATIHGEMFTRFSLSLGTQEEKYLTPDQLQAASGHGNLNPDLVVALSEAARYILISSTGKIPPTLQGIWGGTWRPAWSGDFTLNGNVPSAIASGLNTGFQEVTEAYMNYMYSMFDDFRDNARDMYGAPGIFVPSRSSSSGKTYHYGDYFPHQFWFAGGAWTSQFFFDYWLYTGDDLFLEEKVIPFMLAAAAFYEYILYPDKDGNFMFLPSYSPEIGPLDMHPLSINATMDVAALKQLLRNLLYLEDQGYLDSGNKASWNDILQRLPDYAIDEQGDLKEWIWPGYENDNSHRHASHLYPLFYEVDPDFLADPQLIEAAMTAIEKRLEYRRENNGAEMAFGLVQKGLAAAHIGDRAHAYECVDWLCHSYWSPSFTAYHDPGEIFNVDICGGLPALITEMIIQSTKNEILLLPVLPESWSEGAIEGVGTRCGVTVDLVWEDGIPVSANLKARKGSSFDLVYRDQRWAFKLAEGQEAQWKMSP